MFFYAAIGLKFIIDSVFNEFERSETGIEGNVDNLEEKYLIGIFF